MLRVLAIALAASLTTLTVRSEAQPTPTPDFARAKQLYDAASSELDKGAYVDAVRDFGAAYDITKDPVVFYKIAVANEKSGKCDVALVYYARYVREAKPAQHFVDLTKERVAACGGDWRSLDAKPAGKPTDQPTDQPSEKPTDRPTDQPADNTDTLAGVATGSGRTAKPPGSVATGSTTGSTVASPEAGSATLGSNAGSARGSVDAGSAAPNDSPPAIPATVHRHGRDLPWLMVGGALAFVTAGAVLAYSANSSEQDIRDLYVGLNNMSRVFDAKTQQRYQELLDEGHRYQYLSWGAFGIATGFVAAATILFVRDHDEDQQRVIITPTATPTSAGASATIRF